MAEGKSAPAVGEMVAANYRILGTAGSGGMGVVYRALDLKLQRTVALKFLPPELNASERDRERFLREARTASSLDHPNVGVIYGIEETADERTFISMAYYEGRSLAQRIRSGPLSPAEAVAIAIQILQGLSHAHLQGIEHRDIKPSNIMLTQQGAVKIVDFGLAHVSQQTASKTHGISGTVAYMSPEQTLGKPVDGRSDLWAAGVVLEEMLIGQHPFSRETIPATVFAILNEPPQPMTGKPLELQQIVYRALSKDPQQRYQDCGEMLQDLERARAALGAAPATSGSSRRDRAELQRYVDHASKSAWLPKAQSRWLPWLIGLLPLGLVLSVVLLIPSIRRVAFRSTGGASVVAPAPPRAVPHIAVLPFNNIGNNPANAVLAEGLMESLASKLSNLNAENESLWVLPSSVVRARRIDDPVSALKELGATMVVQGSIERQGQHVHLTLNLIDTKELHQIGSVALDNGSGDLASLQDKAVSQLARLMRVDVAAAGLNPAASSQTPLAYENYLKSLGYLQRYDKPGNVALAISTLKETTASDPHFALAFAQLGEAYRLDYVTNKNPKSLAEATANCRRALELDNRLPAAYVTLGRLHDQSGNRDLALQEFERALALDPRNADALAGTALTYEHAGRIGDAEAAFRRAAAMRPDYWDGYNSLGNFFDRNQKYAEAIAAYKQAIELTPDNAAIYVNLGAAYLDTGDAKSQGVAEEALKKSISLAPSYAAYANLGDLYLSEKRYRDAAMMTEKALELNSSDYLVWANLSTCYEWLGVTAKAAAADRRELALLEDQVKLHPSDAQMQSNLACLYGRQKRAAEAMRRLQTALALQPDDPRVLLNAGETYEELGDRAKAIDYIKEALRKGVTMDDLRTDSELTALLADPGFRAAGK